MSMLAFFPRLKLEADLTVEGYRLLRFERGRLPGREQLAIDSVLEAYLEGENRAVRRATVLTGGERGLTDDLTDDEMADLFEVADLVAFAGLAGREYFVPVSYTNRETFSFIVQQFQSTGGGVAVRSRRRDGATQSYFSASQNRVRRPLSQHGVGGVSLSPAVVSALLQARGHKDWEHLSEAIYFFNRANTDSDLVSEESECVEMAGAIERLLRCYHGREDELIERFLALWKPATWLDPTLCERIPADRRRPSVVEAWLRDFFGYRGFHAHGRREVRRPTVWSRREHLLLGAFAFPLLVKLWLNERELYALTEQDEVDIDILERLICAKHFEPQPEDAPHEHPWPGIRGEAAFHRAFERGWKKHSGDTTTHPRPAQGGEDMPEG
jgi:hypothetical protein